MSPEQCRGKKVDYRSDIYALGVLTHELLTGKAPFDGETALDLLFKHTAEPPEPKAQGRFGRVGESALVALGEFRARGAATGAGLRNFLNRRAT